VVGNACGVAGNGMGYTAKNDCFGEWLKYGWNAWQ